MKHEALYSAVLGAAPTVLIAYILEYRFITRKPLLGHKVLAGVIIGANVLAACFALAFLGLGEPVKSHHPYPAELVVVLFLVGICGLLAELAEGVIRGITSNA